MKKEVLDALIEREIKKWPGTKYYYHPTWECKRMDVAGKMFGYLGENKEEQNILTIKGTLEENLELRTMFAWIVPGYYMNKDHWNSILINDEHFGEEKLLGLIKESYDIVVAKLPKKVKEELVH